MKVLVTANIVPFMPGGADYHINGVARELKRAGHEVELIRFPFRFSPEADIEQLMAYTETLDLNRLNGVEIDRVISLQFPAYGVQHDQHVVWIMHQHRAVYELYEKQAQTPPLQQLKHKVQDFDGRVLGRAKQLFANSQRVADRLQQYNGLSAKPLYHPPHMAEQFYCEEDLGYIFCPSRLERLKRQDLLIEAMQYCKTPVKAIIAGDGGQRAYYQGLVEQLGLEDRVKLIGKFTEAEKFAYYARALAVFFAPFDEDYGYITLEGMLSGKPVITCEDSGGPLEFVRDGENGFVLPPQPEAIAEKLDQLYADRKRSREMGQQARADYDRQQISWQNVVDSLLA
ncbi:glycosyltransferase family 4 protein [Marinobacterium arenosum]|uniref:glycosyltransferase family 4 protein n=1 Tax=Marinobacterium arenosum TaxID=2862496 RepID=UPI001C95FB30|nr:glycosyltransferase family 4 protein [Marinobacterium arenosum]MBY4676801.1 glycosyltransferase family 4 protein [Marinobacterium arenosum]